MTTEETHALAIALGAVWLASGALAWRGHRAMAVAINLLFAVPLGGLALASILRVVIDQEGYVRQYGSAALGDLPLTATGLALSLVAIVASLVSLRWRPTLFLVGWIANAPTLLFVVYMAFWFHIF